MLMFHGMYVKGSFIESGLSTFKLASGVTLRCVWQVSTY